MFDFLILLVEAHSTVSNVTFTQLPLAGINEYTTSISSWAIKFKYEDVFEVQG